MTSIAVSLVWLFAQVSIVLVVVAAVYAVLGRVTPRTRSAVLGTGLSVTFGLSLLAFSPWPNWWPRPGGEGVVEESFAPSTETSVAVAASPTERVESPEIGIEEPSAPAVELESTWAAFAGGFVESLRNPVPVDVPTEERPWWPFVVVGLYGTAVGVGLLRLFAGWWAVERLRRTGRAIDDPVLNELLDVLRAEAGCRRPIAVRESDVVSPAATFGWRRPVVLLAVDWRTWTADELRAVLAHEVAHVRRGDFLTILWTELGVLLHFYHPLMHWLANRTRLEHELAADAAAAAVTGGPRSYLRILAEMVLRQPSQRTSWSVATFLPTRRTFTRRIEVLRESRESGVRSGRTSATALVVATTLLLGTGLVVAGLRNPGTTETTEATSGQDRPVAETGVADEFTPSTELDLSHVPRDVPFLWQVDFSALRAMPEFEKLAEGLKQLEDANNLLGVPFDEMQRLTFTIVPSEQPGRNGRTIKDGEPLVIVESSKDVDAAQLARVGRYEAAGEKDGTELFQSAGGSHIALPGPRTVLYSGNESDLAYALPERNWADKAAWAGDVRRVKDADIVLFGNVLALRDEIGDELPRNQPANSGLALFMPLYESVNTSVLGISFDDEEVVFDGFVACTDEAGANEVSKTMTAALVLGQNWVKQARLSEIQNAPREYRALFDDALKFAEGLLGSLEVSRNGSMVEIRGRAKGAGLAFVVGALLPAVQQAREAARRAQSQNNLKQIALAMHNYHDVHGHLPPPVLTGPDGKTKYSWRVAILPYLEQQALYEQYDRTQPWDSEVNKKVAETIVPVYHDPSSIEPQTTTSYFALVGKGTMFDPEANNGNGVRFRDVTDGLSNTLMIVEANRKTPWTKPEDIEVDLTKEDLPKFGGSHGGIFLAGLADGSVRAIAQTIDEKVLRILIGRNEGQPLPNGF